MSSRTPRVSIGVPVYNGQRYLREALDSILAQTFSDFEVVICDNASTDNTQTICEEYSARDSRVRYHRNNVNIGASGNFNRTFELSSGTYFKWAAHDDTLAPDFLAKGVRVLDENSDVVLVYSKTRIIDDKGEHVTHYKFQLGGEAVKPQDRFKETLRGHRCYEIFGLIRSDVLRQTRLMGNFGHGDGVLLSRLCLSGVLYEIPEYLFFARQHPEQSMNVYGAYKRMDYYQYSVWFDPKNARRFIFPHWRIFQEYLDAVSEAGLHWRSRMECYYHLMHWANRWKGPLVRDLVYAGRQAVRIARSDAAVLAE
jgi:glycosyltransferase involved in cell wall biosynthesis